MTDNAQPPAKTLAEARASGHDEVPTVEQAIRWLAKFEKQDEVASTTPRKIAFELAGIHSLLLALRAGGDAIPAKEVVAPPGFKLEQAELDDDCGCPEETWGTPYGSLNMHLSAGDPSNAHLDNGDEGEWEVTMTLGTVAEARAAFFGWAAGLMTDPTAYAGDDAGAAEERDALLSALGWKTGPFRDAQSRKVILDDSAGLRPEMVKARQAAQEAQCAADDYRYMLGEYVHGSRSGVLGRLWEEVKRLRAASPKPPASGDAGASYTANAYVVLEPDAEDVRLLAQGALAGCPCCGGTPSTFARLFPHSGIYQAYVNCSRCHVQVLSNARDRSEAREQAIAAWSKRPVPAGGDAGAVDLREAARLALMYLETGFIECPQCGHEVPTKDLDAVWQIKDGLASVDSVTTPSPVGESTSDGVACHG